MTVAMAFDHFEREQVDIAIVEVGMGGRLDSTNILKPLLSVITNIGHDHMEFLGSELAQIAGEKAGIIKQAVPVIIGESDRETNDVFIQGAVEKGCDIYFADQHFSIPYSFYTKDHKQSLNVYRDDILQYEKLVIDLLGIYQRSNVITTLLSFEFLEKCGFSIPVESIYSGFKNVISNTGFLGRWQILNAKPLMICDTGHNLEGIQSVVSQINQTPHKKLWMVIGTVDDKNVKSILDVWPKEATYFFTQAPIPRAMDAKKLSKEAAIVGLKGEVIPNVKDAADRARSMAGPDDLVFIGGSTFVVAEVL
jgi:dihydrofolate synthase/folylpolyglutamate synthase